MSQLAQDVTVAACYLLVVIPTQVWKQQEGPNEESTLPEEGILTRRAQGGGLWPMRRGPTRRNPQ